MRELLALLDADRNALASSPELLNAMSAVADEHGISLALVIELVTLSMAAAQLDAIAEGMEESG